jgi:site-specific DNA-methyltransferase (adenine-specific)
MITMLNMDCMEFMKNTPDKAFSLSIVDPPYGIGEDGRKSQSRMVSSKKWANPGITKHKASSWDDSPPEKIYFNELIRVSKNQIIWGANHFISKIPYDSPCWIVWKKNGQNENCDFADCELAWSSFETAVRFFDFAWTGFGAKNAGETKIHPTQKPVALYKWLLSRYAKPGDRILDTHGGSGSIAIACHDLGYDLTWMELDKDYYDAAVKRYKEHASQPQMFIPEPQKIVQGDLLD